MTASRREVRTIPFLHLVTDDAVVDRPDFLASATAAVRSGGPEVAIQLRARNTSGRKLYELASRLLPAAREAGSWLLVNDRCDVGLAAGADGVHLREHGLEPRVARDVLGAGPVLGRSAHLTTALAREELEALDYLVVGSLFSTGSHPDREPAGPAVIARFLGTGLPLIAIGGITPDRVGDARRAGAAGVAVLSGVWRGPDAAAAVSEYRSAWKGAG